VAFFLLVLSMALKARKQPVVTGSEELAGARGEVLELRDGEWWARVHSELWRVRSAQALKEHMRVRVTGRDGLILIVVPEEVQTPGG
jgi:membrane-bound serine protease (ClpP class)